MSLFEFLFSRSDQDEIGKAFDAALADAFPAPILDWANRADDTDKGVE